MSLKKLSNITPAELKSKGVVSLADKPNAAASYGVGGLSPTALKLWFDQLSKLLSDKINAIQSTLSADNAAEYIKLVLPGLYKNNESEEYSLQDLCNAFKDGKFAEYLQFYRSAASQELNSLQSIINNFGADISEALEISEGAATTATDAKNNSIESVNVFYQEGENGTIPPEGLWSENIPFVTEGKYLWTKIVLNFVKGKQSTFYSVGRIGEKGDDIYGFVVENGNLIRVKADAKEDSVEYAIDEYGNLFATIRN